MPNINLVHIHLTSYTKALCFNISKGFLEFDSLENLLDLIDYISCSTNIELVGQPDKVRIDTDLFVYRQRIFFTTLADIFSLCGQESIEILFTDTVYFITQNVSLDVNEEKYLSFYAKQQGFDNYNDWLLNTCKVYIMFYLRLKNIEHISLIDDEALQYIKDRKGCLDRAPYLMSIYDLKQKNYIVFQQTDLEDPRLYTPSKANSILNYGFTNRNVLDDKKRGVFSK